MCALILFALAQLQAVEALAGPDGVRLADAREFAFGPEAVRSLWRISAGHAGAVRDRVVACNLPETVCMWERECTWRWAVWNELDNVLNCQMSQRDRMRCLCRLRDLLGPDAYDARLLPLPTPSYRGLGP